MPWPFLIPSGLFAASLVMSEPPKTFAEASANYDSRNRENKVILVLIVAPLAIWFLTWLVSQFL